MSRNDYDCPSREELEAYGRVPRLRKLLDEHAQVCPECSRRLALPRRRLGRNRLGTLTGLLLILLSGWWAPAHLCAPSPGPALGEAPGPAGLPTRAASPADVQGEGVAAAIQIGGYTFHGDAADRIRASFEDAKLVEIQPGDTLSSIARKAYGHNVSQTVWEALLQFNNHPENPRRFAGRYETELEEYSLTPGDRVQVPSESILLLIANRTEVVATNTVRP